MRIIRAIKVVKSRSNSQQIKHTFLKVRLIQCFPSFNYGKFYCLSYWCHWNVQSLWPLRFFPDKMPRGHISIILEKILEYLSSQFLSTPAILIQKQRISNISITFQLNWPKLSGFQTWLTFYQPLHRTLGPVLHSRCSVTICIMFDYLYKIHASITVTMRLFFPFNQIF